MIVKIMLYLNTSMWLGSAKTVGRINSCRCQRFCQTHPEVYTSQVHHHWHAHAVGVGVEIRPQSYNHTMGDHISDGGWLQSEDVGCGWQDHSYRPRSGHSFHSLCANLWMSLIRYQSTHTLYLLEPLLDERWPQHVVLLPSWLHQEDVARLRENLNWNVW